MRTALTIAGSDSSGGAGIQADLKTFEALGVFGTSAITAITAQNTVSVTAVEALSPALVRAQIDAVATDFHLDAVKIGMLAHAGLIEAVAAALEAHHLPRIVVDTVMIAKSGAVLLDQAAVDTMRARLLPLAAVVTPNVPEAEALTGMRIQSPQDLEAAARRLVALGARAAVVKGGHLPGPAIDVLFDGTRVTYLEAARIETTHTHGTGCTFSAALAARLALGDDVVAAARFAKAYVTGAIAHAPGLGHGHGPLLHAWRQHAPPGT